MHVRVCDANAILSENQSVDDPSKLILYTQRKLYLCVGVYYLCVILFFLEFSFAYNYHNNRFLSGLLAGFIVTCVLGGY